MLMTKGPLQGAEGVEQPWYVPGIEAGRHCADLAGEIPVDEGLGTGCLEVGDEQVSSPHLHPLEIFAQVALVAAPLFCRRQDLGGGYLPDSGNGLQELAAPVELVLVEEGEGAGEAATGEGCHQ